MSAIIKVENLGKKYILRHQQKERYTALRDVITNKVKEIGRTAIHPFSSSTQKDSRKEEFWALKDVSFEINRGERVGIIGRNGAGKTTLLKVLSRITEPTTGRIMLKGRVASLLEVGTGFHPELTGRENIFLNGAILGMGKAEIKRKFDEIVDFAEIEKFLDTPVKRYSSGMYVRLAFAVAAHLEPEILIVDEVLAVGDAQFQKKCLGKMEDIGKEGRTVLFVSHNMTAVQSLCSTVAWLSNGKLMGLGDVNGQVDKYLNSGIEGDRIDSHRYYKLGSNLILKRFEFSPNPVISGRPQNFNLVVESISKEIIDSIVLLIYSRLGIRVAILDLRTHNYPLHVDGGSQFEINGLIKSLPLVEGDYNIGIFVKGDKTYKDFFDVINVVVKAPNNNEVIIKYPPSVRGYLELEYTLF
jgi:lipopolysaccharide transport system ATP-binding protein